MRLFSWGKATTNMRNINIERSLISAFAFFSVILNSICYWLSTLMGSVTGILILMLVFFFLVQSDQGMEVCDTH
ncbi:hypothetical protein N7451_008926 [Penicillium sp. IBT 35674x]|nr:hypothetical protein N7451_008926 [Penicillium sp. IBT 35674x]